MEENKNEEKQQFLKETIKSRPMNKKKLLQKTIVTVITAIVFGFVFCFIFLLLEPRIDKWINKDDGSTRVEFPEETVDEEMLPENMLTEEDAPAEDLGILDIKDYEELYTALATLADNTFSSVVTVTSVQADTDWFQNVYQNQGQSSGVIVAQNGLEYLILVRESAVNKADSIVIIFHNGSQATATLKQTDPGSGYAIVAVNMNDLTEEEREAITVATLGSSNMAGILGSPIMVLGSPMGTSGGISYGSITSTGTSVSVVDSNYKLMMTDIYGSSSASGVLVNMKGQVIGIVDNSFNALDVKNMISAIGISEMKQLIQNMSNDMAVPYLGIRGLSVTNSAYENDGVPYGAYITNVIMESPAMLAGLQSGDIITQFDGEEINNFGDLSRILLDCAPGEAVRVKVQRQSQGGYSEMSLKVTLK